MLLSAIAGCGPIDEIREVFDTQVPGNELDTGAAEPTVAPVALRGRLTAPTMKVVDHWLVYDLDPGDDARAESDGSDPGAPPLVHLEIHLEPNTNLRDLEGLRSVLETYEELGALPAELSGDEVVRAARLLYDDDPALTEALTSARGRPLLLLAHRWPSDSGLSEQVAAELTDHPGVASVNLGVGQRIHRSALPLDVDSRVTAAIRPFVHGRSGIAVAEGQRLVLLTWEGTVIASTLVPRGDLPAHLSFEQVRPDLATTEIDTRAGTAEAASEPPIGCSTPTQRGDAEVRTCRAGLDEVSIEYRNDRGPWQPVAASPGLPDAWLERPPIGSLPSAAGWARPSISPDGSQVLVSWTGSCRTAGAAILDLETTSLRWLGATRREPWGGATSSVQWRPDGVAVIAVSGGACPALSRQPGLFTSGAPGGDVSLWEPPAGSPGVFQHATWALDIS